MGGRKLLTLAAGLAVVAAEASDKSGDDDVALLVTPRGALHRVDRTLDRQQPSFSEFVVKHGFHYEDDEYSLREALFNARAREVERQNSRQGASWRAGINRLAAHTEQELARLRGYVRGGSRTEGVVSIGGSGRISMLQVPSKPARLEDLPETWGWRGKLNATKNVLNQGGCGSCWAVASVTTLRAHSELFQQDEHFSIQQVVACAPNPHKCGGDGGCSGATAEIAMDYAARVGLLTEDDWPYTGEDMPCRPEQKLPDQDAPDTSAASRLIGYKGAKSGLIGYHKLPSNKLQDMMLSLHNLGPITVSVAAGFGWNQYESGIYDGCKPGEVIDHAVVLVGYGKDKETGVNYWQLQNSWGPDWGEEGFIRMLRQGNEEEEAFCGWDMEPLKGSGCEGGPPRVRTCGMCGILYDAVVPHFSEGNGSWWARHAGSSEV